MDVIVDSEDLAMLISEYDQAGGDHGEEDRSAFARVYDRLSDATNPSTSRQAAGLIAQREMLREVLQKVLVHVGMIEPWAGLGDLDAFNDGPLLCVAGEDFIVSCPDAKDRLTHPLFTVAPDGHIALVVDQNARMRGALRALEQWDMLSLRPDGHGAATADAPWARALIAAALADSPEGPGTIDGVPMSFARGVVFTRASDYAEMAALLGEPLATAIVTEATDASQNGVYVVTKGSWER